jgi:hypothetical protein
MTEQAIILHREQVAVNRFFQTIHRPFPSNGIIEEILPISINESNPMSDVNYRYIGYPGSRLIESMDITLGNRSPRVTLDFGSRNVSATIRTYGDYEHQPIQFFFTSIQYVYSGLYGRLESDSIPSIRTAFPLTSSQIYTLQQNIPASIKSLKRQYRLAKILLLGNNKLTKNTFFKILRKLYYYTIPDQNELDKIFDPFIIYKIRKEILRLDLTQIDDIDPDSHNYNKLFALLKGREFCVICCNYKNNLSYIHDETHDKVCMKCLSKLELCPFCRIQI